MNKIKIIALECGNGVSYHRVIKPMQRLMSIYPDDYEIHFMNVKDKDISKLPNPVEHKFDIIYFNTILGIDEKSPLLRYLEVCLIHGAKIVLDIDDYFKFGRSVAVKKTTADKHHELVPEAIKAADYVTTTTETYRQKLLELNNNVYVFPNFADSYDEQYVVKKTHSDVIRIGVTGSVMHKYDVRLLNMVSMLLKRDGLIDRVKFVLCGYSNNIYYHEYEKIITSDYRIVSRQYKHILENKQVKDVDMDGQPYRRVSWRNTNEYMTIYNDIDVLLAPLENTVFNEAKSQIKYIEAGYMDTLFIGSDVPSYNMFVEDGKNGFLCKSSKDFYETIKKVILGWESTNGFRNIRDNARIDIENYYESIPVTSDRDIFFKSIVNGK